ncbi:MAG: shikimate kinase [Rhodocyclaceae bacterium]|nr:shikimate kinase [Rhodocyclaceae bacterium]MDZ4215845.1 shikimate kinase [Rhodocyclaceae bacterium]
MGAICLIGMMGAGKTTVGKKLAKKLDLQFTDLDQEVERHTGVSVATVFEIEGELGFRQRETHALRQVIGRCNQIVATGGGVVLSPINRAILCGAGCVVYLQATPELIYSRTRHDTSRPLLQVADPLGRIRSLVSQRDPLYREVADIVIESGRPLGNTIEAIETALRLHSSR